MAQVVSWILIIGSGAFAVWACLNLMKVIKTRLDRRKKIAHGDSDNERKEESNE